MGAHYYSNELGALKKKKKKKKDGDRRLNVRDQLALCENIVLLI